MSWPEVRAYAERTDLFSSVAAHANETALVTIGDGTSASITASIIFTTPNYFSILNVRPAIGTEPVAEPNVMQMTVSPTAMISDAMWKQKFGGARDVIGRIVRLNDIAVQIVGVAQPSFVGTGGSGRMTMWVPLAAYPVLQKRGAAAFVSADSVFLTAFARLHAGVSTDGATPIVAGLAARIFRPGADSETGSADVVPMLASNSRVSERADLLISGAASGGFARC